MSLMMNMSKVNYIATLLINLYSYVESLYKIFSDFKNLYIFIIYIIYIIKWILNKNI